MRAPFVQNMYSRAGADTFFNIKYAKNLGTTATQSHTYIYIYIYTYPSIYLYIYIYIYITAGEGDVDRVIADADAAQLRDVVPAATCRATVRVKIVIILKTKGNRHYSNNNDDSNNNDNSNDSNSNDSNNSDLPRDKPAAGTELPMSPYAPPSPAVLQRIHLHQSAY